jgi:cyclophilin family peptidyl-prolyl cis-trans isomerase/HEAT repeat protein
VRTLAAVLVAAAVAQAQGPSLRDRMLAAEDARAASPEAMGPLLQGLRSRDPRLVVAAVRALGRFERPHLAAQLMPFVTHARPEVRAEAANALGQTFAAIPRAPDATAPLPEHVGVVTKALLARVRTEPDPYVTGVVAETLGRLPFRSADAMLAVERALAALLPIPDRAVPVRAGVEPAARLMHPAAVAGALKGLETRIRVYQKLAPPEPATIARLRGAATLGSDSSEADLGFVRRVAWTALNGARGADLALIDRGLEDPDQQVRRLAVLALGSVEAPADERSGRVERSLRDRSHLVRYDAVRVYNRTLQKTGCAPLLAATDDPSAHVALAAIDALGDGCPAGPSAVATLIALSGRLRGDDGRWHRPAHAFVSLARVAPDQGSERMPTFAEHPTWQVRMYAARAAAALMSEARLERLARDAHDNVREAAIAGLATVRGHAADAAYLEALSRADYQLLLTAANALKGSPNGERAAPALLDALKRVTADRRETSRDTRLALLDRLQELGGSRHAAALQGCLADFDPEVARRCAAVLTAWTGTAHRPEPRIPPVPAGERQTARRARITMRGGGAIELSLFGNDAPATVGRFARLARQGYYNGLTFHRVVPNFVLQGGSPGANEYMGDGPFMRDELGLRTHARGTLGISTRGRDTGDAQIFVNLVDNLRLDHNYTVFAEITAGMDVADDILEGDVIERVDVLEPTSSESRR